MGLSTKDLGTDSGGGMAKTIATGNKTLKINSISLEDFQFIDGAKHLIMHVETEPIEEFEGFFIDKDNESKGKYAGQIGRVKASQYAFADGQTKSGIKIQRDRSIMIFLQNLCKTLGINDWFIAQDNVHDTVQDLVDEFNRTAPFQNRYLSFCVGGKEYISKTGYTNYDMYLPKSDKGKYAFAEKDSDKVVIYSEATHLKKAEVTEVKQFGEDDDLSLPKKVGSDFDLD